MKVIEESYVSNKIAANKPKNSSRGKTPVINEIKKKKRETSRRNATKGSDSWRDFEN